MNLNYILTVSQKEFTIIEAPDMDKLSKSVALSVAHGWKPIGDVSKHQGEQTKRIAFVQGMTRDCKDESKNT